MNASSVRILVRKHRVGEGNPTFKFRSYPRHKEFFEESFHRFDLSDLCCEVKDELAILYVLYKMCDMIFNTKFITSLISTATLIGMLTGCGSSGGDDGAGGGGGGTTPPPATSATRMKAGIQPDSTGLTLVKNIGTTIYRLQGKIYVVRADGSTASTPQPPAVITLRVTNLTTGLVAVSGLRMSSRTFTVVQPDGSTRPGWEYSAPITQLYSSYAAGQTLRIEAIDDTAKDDDNLLDGNLEWLDTTVVPNAVKAPPIEIGTLTVLGGAG